MRHMVPLLGMVGLLVTVSCGGSSSSGDYLPRTYRHASVALSDLDQDGALDVAISRGWTDLNQSIFSPNRSRSFVTYRLNKGGSTGFTSAVSTTVGTSPGWIGAEDVNLDGRPDILVGEALGLFPMRLLLQDPSGQQDFLPPTIVTRGSTDAVVVDLTGDGAPDILGRGLGLTLIPQAPSTPGTFLAESDFLPGVSVSLVAVADVNTDGWADLGLYDLASQRAAVVLQDALSPGNFFSPDWYAVNRVAVDLTWMDTNQDGLLDLVALCLGKSGNPDHLRIWTQKASAPGTLTTPSNKVDAGLSDSRTALLLEQADCNSDGLSDLAILAGGSAPEIVVLLQDRKPLGAFLDDVVYTGKNTMVFDIALGDLNDDGALDLVVAAMTQTFVKYQSKQTPADFGPPVVLVQR